MTEPRVRFPAFGAAAFFVVAPTLRKAKGGKWLILSDMDNGNSRP